VLQFVAELEQTAVARVVAECLEDELRLRSWLMRPSTRRRLRDALQDALDEFAGRAP
jgi:hypothetical protein